MYLLMIVLFVQLVNRSWERNAPLQSSVYDAWRWFHDNNLPINIKKTICMLKAFEGSPNRVALEEHTLSLWLSGITLEQIQATPHLGLQLDDKLQWDAHVQKLCWNISSKLAVLGRLRKIFNKKYFANSISHAHKRVLTVSFLSGIHAQSKPDLICRLQRRAARIITGNFGSINTRGADFMKTLGLQTR